MDAQEEEALSAEGADDDDVTMETPEQRAARKARLTWLKELCKRSADHRSFSA
jgi:hypothetical protein